MESKHTPGPWHEMDVLYSAQKVANGAAVYPTDSKDVAPFLKTLEEQTQANAALIAAAPDMYAILWTLLEEEDVPEGWKLAKVREALAKAAGVEYDPFHA